MVLFFYYYSNNNIQNNSPALVANLWDVTDKDIDRFSEELFQKWNLKSDVVENDTQKIDKNMSLVKAVSIAREKCKWKFLVGAAPVIYGIPCYLK